MTRVSTRVRWGLPALLVASLAAVVAADTAIPLTTPSRVRLFRAPQKGSQSLLGTAELQFVVPDLAAKSAATLSYEMREDAALVSRVAQSLKVESWNRGAINPAPSSSDPCQTAMALDSQSAKLRVEHAPFAMRVTANGRVTLDIQILPDESPRGLVVTFAIPAPVWEPEYQLELSAKDPLSAHVSPVIQFGNPTLADWSRVQVDFFDMPHPVPSATRAVFTACPVTVPADKGAPSSSTGMAVAPVGPLPKDAEVKLERRELVVEAGVDDPSRTIAPSVRIQLAASPTLAAHFPVLGAVSVLESGSRIGSLELGRDFPPKAGKSYDAGTDNPVSVERKVTPAHPCRYSHLEDGRIYFWSRRETTYALKRRDDADLGATEVAVTHKVAEAWSASTAPECDPPPVNGPQKFSLSKASPEVTVYEFAKSRESESLRLLAVDDVPTHVARLDVFLRNIHCCDSRPQGIESALKLFQRSAADLARDNKKWMSNEQEYLDEIRNLLEEAQALRLGRSNNAVATRLQALDTRIRKLRGEIHDGETTIKNAWLEHNERIRSVKTNNSLISLKIPRGLPDVPVPEDNLITDAKIHLGRQLFFDKRLSRDMGVSCASCHQPSKGWSDASDLPEAFYVLRGEFNTGTLINSAYGTSQFWDGRVFCDDGEDRISMRYGQVVGLADCLEKQALDPIQNPRDMNFTLIEMERTLNTIPGYRRQFQEVFGRNWVTATDVARAIATFERTILSGNSPYDKFESGHKDALSESARAGRDLFFGKAKCSACHSGPNFTDGMYHKIIKDKLHAGYANVSGADSDRHRFKTPTLRDVARTAPYMHNGSLEKLSDVIDHYLEDGVPDPQENDKVQSLELSKLEQANLIEFLEKGLAGDPYPSIDPPDLPE